MSVKSGHKTLIIAEKPSVARDLARCLGPVPKKDDWFENDSLVISSAVGHLVELFMPEDFSPEFKRWSLATLPIIPGKFQLKPIEKSEAQFKLLKKLITRKDVACVINACDAGREGELIFTYIAELAGNQKPVKRMWMSSMTPDAIRKAFAQLRDASEMLPLQDAARSRSEADWLVGINGTRAATLQYGSIRSSATVGRVQTPTLALICDREREIVSFKPRTFWRIQGEFALKSGIYTGFYQKPRWKKPADEHDRVDRLWSREEAEALVKATSGVMKASVVDQKKRKKESAPRLFDLTSLQREANSRFGYPAGMTLNIAQSLYEKHKVLTYPRTDSKALPEDYGPTVRQTLFALNEPYALYATAILQNNWVVTANKRVFNNAEVSDHFAIIPTDVTSAKLNENESKIYDAVVRRFLAVFYPAAEYDVTTRLSTVAPDHTFKTEGKVLVIPGWLETQGRSSSRDETLPAITPPDGSPPMAAVKGVTPLEDHTRPPARYTEATLLAAMEGAGKLLEDEELAEAMKERGLGTPATRAATIDHLVNVNYLVREGRELHPTAKAEGLMDFLHKLGVDVLRDASMTGEWEYKLRQVEEGKLSRKAFMDGIEAMTREMIQKMACPPPAEQSTIINPMTGSPLLENHKSWLSTETVLVRGRAIPALQINKVIGNRRLEASEAIQLLQKNEIGPLEGFKSRAGKPFSAVLKLIRKDNGSLRVDFDFGDSDSGDPDGGEAVVYPEIGVSPFDGTPVRATPKAFVSDGVNAKGEPRFRISRNLLGKTLTEDIIREMLAKGKSGLIKGLKSNKTGRLFDAMILPKDDGGITFEFPVKEKAARKTAKKKETSPAEANHGELGENVPF